MPGVNRSPIPFLSPDNQKIDGKLSIYGACACYRLIHLLLSPDNSPRSGGIRSAPLNTHKPASHYDAFAPDKARRLVERFERHYTPKHGSWLNMAESERGALASQFLGRRTADKQKLTTEFAAWESHRNTYHTKANWQFTTDDARIKLKHLYPTY